MSAITRALIESASSFKTDIIEAEIGQKLLETHHSDVSRVFGNASTHRQFRESKSTVPLAELMQDRLNTFNRNIYGQISDVARHEPANMDWANEYLLHEDDIRTDGIAIPPRSAMGPGHNDFHAQQFSGQTTEPTDDFNKLRDDNGSLLTNTNFMGENHYGHDMGGTNGHNGIATYGRSNTQKAGAHNIARSIY